MRFILPSESHEICIMAFVAQVGACLSYLRGPECALVDAMNTPIFAIIWVSHPVWWTYVNRHDLFRHTRCLSRSDSRRYKKVKNLDFLMLWCRFSQSYEVYLEHEICMAWICRLTWCLSACLTFKVQNLDLVMKWHPFQSTGWQLILVNISRISLIENACTHGEENIFCCAGDSISTSARTQYQAVYRIPLLQLSF